MLQGGFGSAILETLSERDITGFHMVRIGIADVFVEHGPQKVLRSEYGIDVPDIVKAARRLMKTEGIENLKSQAPPDLKIGSNKQTKTGLAAR